MCFSSHTSLFTRPTKREKDHFAYQAELLLNSTVHPGYLQVSLIPALWARTFRMRGWRGREEWKADGVRIKFFSLGFYSHAENKDRASIRRVDPGPLDIEILLY